MINWCGFTLTDKKRGVLGTGQVKQGGLSTGQARKNGGLRHVSGQKRGSLLRHIPVLDIYVSAPPPWDGRSSQETILFPGP